MKKAKYILLPAIVIVVVYFLFFNPEILGNRLYEGSRIPAGTFISWIGLFVYSLFFYSIYPIKVKSSRGGILRRMLFINLVLASFWGIISFWLAGNWAYNFDNRSIFYFWIAITASIFLIPLAVFLILGLKQLFASKSK